MQEHYCAIFSKTMIQQFVLLCLATGLASAVCPDGSTCPYRTTCCKKPNGGYTCCPLPQWKEAKATPLVQAGTPNAVTENICLDNTECPPEYTCMPTSKGFYGCCPFTKATICKDWEHCCPKGYECDLIEAKCKRTGAREDKLPLISAVDNLRTDDSELCGNMTCSGGYTCCRLKNFGWGCCPMKDAVCCDDHYCCPKDFKCDKAKKTCIKPVDENEKAIICPDGGSECPDGSTCCILPNQLWGCCPLEKAVCCEDRLHCCPSETRCDLKQSKCVSQFGMMEMWKKFPAFKRFTVKDTKVQYVWCNETVFCPDNNTCCKLPSGEFGCCPAPKAVCCEDHVHCCPHGFECDSEGHCYQRGISIPWMTKTPAIVQVTVRDVKCDETKSCPDNQTCCEGLSGDWACCPIPQAVCCEDHTHCCPNGYTCDIQKGLCKTKDSFIPMVLKLTSSMEKMKKVCCKDHIQRPDCCPKGFKCNPDTGDCYKMGISIPWMTKTPAIVQGTIRNVKCDETKSCADNQTCCKGTSGGWACCPIPQAVCCEDHIHCCPSGYTCDVQKGMCEMKDSSIPMVLKLTNSMEKMKDEICDDGTICPSGSSCCKNNAGGWNCCPLPQAVCCDDHVHCCPNGYICDVQAGVCHKGNIFIPLVPKIPNVVKSGAAGVQCDDKVACETGTTCCRNSLGSWSCCPYQQAVCCDDKVHCCPDGYICDVDHGQCLGHAVSFPWTTNKAATMKFLEKSDALGTKCDDTMTCPTGNTCCKQRSGAWGCCPLTLAVCCEDHEHCCPHGYTCNVKAGTCEKQSLSVPWEAKRSPLSDVKCDDTFYCQSPATCCKISSGGWACCPYEQATCCEDKLHCCPKGYACKEKACVLRPQLRLDLFFPKKKKAFSTL
ncbi:progranulin-like isoform X2 [Chiloscyllium plagiosum]|uniref:progranulin-like isoform X2 n=1 Tax=Chiloscyllium plagiosum TaxID=36176 RepID=UPI001CB860EF|nr:progranulin-like isoform X2 [Chiloscyllium plagiosum]